MNLMARAKGAKRTTRNSDKMYLPDMVGNVNITRRRRGVR